MKKYLLTAILILSVLMTVTGCSGGGTAPVLTLGEKEVALGDCTPGNFDSVDLEIGVPGGGIPIGNIPGNSWLSGFLTAGKDYNTYAYLYVYNPDRDEVPYFMSKVYKVDLHFDSEDQTFWEDGSILVNGINFSGMDVSAVKEALADYKLKTDDADHLFYKDGKYSYSIDFGEDGTITEVTLEEEISKSY